VSKASTKATIMRKTREWFSEMDYLVGTVEYWNHHAKRHIDLFGCDLIAFGSRGCILIQVTTGDNHADRKAKLLGMDSTALIKEAGCDVAVFSWRLSPEKRGSKKKVWKPRLEFL